MRGSGLALKTDSEVLARQLAPNLSKRVRRIPDGSSNGVIAGFGMWYIAFSTEKSRPLSTAMICLYSGAITNFRLYLIASA